MRFWNYLNPAYWVRKAEQDKADYIKMRLGEVLLKEPRAAAAPGVNVADEPMHNLYRLAWQSAKLDKPMFIEFGDSAWLSTWRWAKDKFNSKKCLKKRYIEPIKMMLNVAFLDVHFDSANTRLVINAVGY